MLAISLPDAVIQLCPSCWKNWGTLADIMNTILSISTMLMLISQEAYGRY